MKKLYRRSISGLMALLICFTTILGGGITAFAASSSGEVAKSYSIGFPRSGDANLDYSGTWGHDELHYMNGWTSGEATWMTTLHTIGSFDGPACYCIEPGVPRLLEKTYKRVRTFGAKAKCLLRYGLEYLHERIGYPECLYRKLTPNERDYIRAVRMLTSFQETGTIPEALTRNRDNWSEPVKEIRDVYIRYCEEVFKTHATQRSRIAAADRFMRIVIVNKGVVWEDISAKIISEYAMSLAEYAKATVEVHLRGLRYFLHFLYETGNTKQDFSITVPKLCCGTGERIPHMLSTEQVNILLDSIDRGNPIGKRNYAIIMMAACLGMRDSDIVNLKFDNIDWEKSTISFFQKKTNKFLVLPLLPVVGEAIIDYLRNGRPQTDSKYIFVKHRPPFEQATSFYMVICNLQRICFRM